jgi:hypothetical protein
VTEVTAVIPHGWYTDPLEPADVRWWTGEEWTHHVQPRPFAPLPTAEKTEPVETSELVAASPS